jgi:hypothetical protein
MKMTVRSAVSLVCGLGFSVLASAALAVPVNPNPPGIVPEPGAYAMLACGAVTVGGYLMARSRRNRK